LGKAALVVFTPGLVDRMVAAPAWEQGFPPTPGEASTLAFVSFLLLIAGGAELRRLIRPPRYGSIEEATRGEASGILLRLLWEVPLLYLMFQTWDHARDPLWIAVFLLASIPAVEVLSRFLAVVLGVFLVPLFLALT